MILFVFSEIEFYINELEVGLRSGIY